MKNTLIFGGLGAAYAYSTTKPKPKEERWKRTFKFGVGFGAIGFAVDVGAEWARMRIEERERQRLEKPK